MRGLPTIVCLRLPAEQGRDAVSRIPECGTFCRRVRAAYGWGTGVDVKIRIDLFQSHNRNPGIQ